MHKNQYNSRMQYKQLLRKSQVIIIEGERKSGKFTLAMFLMHSILKKNITILTPVEGSFFHRKVLIAKERFASLQDIDEHIDEFCLKSDWGTLKKRYSYDFFRKELESIFNSTTSEIVLFHRFESFFEFQDRFEIEPIFRLVLQLASKNNIKVIFTISTTSSHYDFMIEYIRDFSDLTLRIEEKNLNERLVQITDSLQHVGNAKLDFQSHNNRLVLQEREEESEKDVEKSHFDILIFANDNENSATIELLNYLFSDTERFTVSIIYTAQELLHHLSFEPDLLFFFINENDYRFVETVSLKKQFQKCNFFAITTAPSLRVTDRVELYKHGYEGAFTSNFSIDEFIVLIEKSLNKYFYTDNLNRLSTLEKVLKDEEEMHWLVALASNYRLYFSLFVFSYDADTFSDSKPSREYDFMYVDREHKKIYYFSFNTRKYLADRVENSLQERGWRVKLESACTVENIENCLEI